MLTNKERLIEQFTKLVTTNSPTLGERQITSYLKSKLTAPGLTVQEDDAGKRLGGASGNLYGFLEGNSSLPPSLLGSHMDMVEPSSGKRTILENGVLHSEGSTVLGVGDCSGIAAILEMLRVIQEQKLNHRPVEVLLTTAEEIYCKGAEQFDFSRVRSKEAYVFDCSGPAGIAAYQAPAILSFTAVVHGLASHAGFAPRRGIHAVQATVSAVAAPRLGQIDSDTTLNIGTIQGEKGNNVIPDLCIVTGEIRSCSHETALSLAKKVRRQFETSAVAFGAIVEFEEKLGCRTYETPKDHPVAERFQRACHGINLPGTLERTFGGSDSDVFAQNGITRLAVSSAMYQCHSLEKYAPVEEMIQLAKLARLLITLE